MNKPYKVRIHIISPVHMGCDDIYEPTGFVINRNQRKLVQFDPFDFVDSLTESERKKFIDICSKGTLESILDIYKFMDSKSDVVAGRPVEISDGLIANHQQVLKIPNNNARIKQELNKFIIARTNYNPLDNAPYLPGSGIKGALRTGYLNYLAKSNKLPAANLSGSDLTEKLLGGRFDTDPFRLVLVSDMQPVDEPVSRIGYAVNKKKRQSDREARGPVQILEYIREGGKFEGSISIQSPPEGAKLERPIPADLSFFRHIHDFYQNEFAREEEIMQTVQIPTPVRKNIEDLFGERLGESAFLFRIGRHSGAECVTIDGYRNIKVMGKQGERPKQLPNSTTMWLASDMPNPPNNSGLLPFGWAVMEIVDFDGLNLYQTRLFPGKTSGGAGADTCPAATPMAVKPAVKTFMWENALLSWSPGNGVLTAFLDGKKAEITLAGKKEFVPESLHARLFNKRNTVTAKVTVEPLGNRFTIVLVEV